MNPRNITDRISDPLDNQVMASLASQELLKNLEPGIFDDLLEESEILHLANGEILIRQGDPGDSMFVLLQGQLCVEIENPDGSHAFLDEVSPGATVGEMALLTGQARSATVRAMDDCRLVRISRAGVDRLVEKHPRVMAEFERVLVPRLQRTQLSEILHDLFSDLDVSTFQDLQSRLEWRQFAGGENVYRQGERGDAMVIVINGRLKMITKNPDGSEQISGELRRGSYAGGYVLLTGETYRETVSALRDTDVVFLSQEVFERFIEKHPSAVLRIARTIARQQQPTFQFLSRDASQQINLAIMPCSPEVPLVEFAQRLAGSLEGLGSTLYLSSKRFDDLYGKPEAAQTEPDDPIQPSIVAWLSNREANCSYVVYQADATWTPWTQRCLRQADRIVLVAQAGADPGLSRMELNMRATDARARQELVLLQPENIRQPVGTSSWLAERQVYRHHHIRMQNASDFKRLARLLIGRPNGLVLSGGGARGIAHLGVYHALLESDVDIDLVGGTSMGALAAAAINVVDSAEALDRMAEQYFSAKMLHDFTLPVSSLFASRKINHVLQQIFGELQIEDLWRPFFCISSNLSKSELVVHRRGELWRAVRASVAIPGVFAPLSQDGDILVDGGAMNHFPVDIMRTECEGGTLIAVNASPTKEGGKVWDFGPSISGWQVLWNKLNPFGKSMQVPSLFETMTRATSVNSKYRLHTMLDQADLLIEPDTSRFGVMEWSAYQEIIAAGYQAGKARINEWKKLN